MWDYKKYSFLSPQCLFYVGICDNIKRNNKKRGLAMDLIFERAIARAYIRSFDSKNQTTGCADCGARIKMDGDHCFEFGIFICDECREDRNRIEKDRMIADEMD
jgi:Zn finger protein HypA/HybF involved in hydrogenase expression